MLGTEKTFAEALIALAGEKPIRDIKIAELLAQAKAGRQTFYNHFEDKYDLVRWIYMDYSGVVLTHLDPHNSPERAFEGLFSFFDRQRAFFTRLDNISSEGEFGDFLSPKLRDYYVSLILRRHSEAYLTAEVMFSIDFDRWAFTHSCAVWMRSGMKDPPHLMAQRMVNNMPPSLRKLISL
ncbi:MAG: TetR/AcrR family transcriptional regulator C-terminal domain-containing protein [Oscillospiraceae bacterium]|nr:TetR/AcrR family transcriptional regulator C-terminal domain-containing protein [Oscillospiraceae bacterium]